MKNQVLLTTTSSIKDKNIVDYYGLISASTVLGTSWIKEFKASFSDVFGGVSKTFSKEIDKGKSIVIKELRKKASSVGMNCVLKVSIDIDPIIGNGFNMFMLSATGTAALLEGYEIDMNEEDEANIDININIYDDINEVYNSIYSTNLAPTELKDFTGDEILKLDEETLLHLLAQKEEFYVKHILDGFIYRLKSSNNNIYYSDDDKSKLELLTSYINSNNYRVYFSYLIEKLDLSSAILLKQLHLIDYSNILEILSNQNIEKLQFEVFFLLNIKPKYIDKDNYLGLIELIKYLNSKFDNNIEIKTNGLFQKTEMWVCKKCKQLNEMCNYKCSTCHTDKYGIKSLKTLDNVKNFTINYEKSLLFLTKLSEKLNQYYV